MERKRGKEGGKGREAAVREGDRERKREGEPGEGEGEEGEEEEEEEVRGGSWETPWRSSEALSIVPFAQQPPLCSLLAGECFRGCWGPRPPRKGLAY